MYVNVMDNINDSSDYRIGRIQQKLFDSLGEINTILKGTELTEPEARRLAVMN